MKRGYRRCLMGASLVLVALVFAKLVLRVMSIHRTVRNIYQVGGTVDVPRFPLSGNEVVDLSPVSARREATISEQDIVAIIRDLESFSRLRVLVLNRTPATSAILPDLSRLTCLEELDLSETDIADEGLSEVVKLRLLHRLNISRTLVTDRGVAWLRQNLPANCIVEHGPKVKDQVPPPRINGN